VKLAGSYIDYELIIMITKIILLLSFFLITTSFSSAMTNDHNTRIIKLASPVWQGYVNGDGTGLYVDLLNMIYAPESYKVTVTIAPFKRAAQWLMNNSGHADVMIGISSQCKLQSLGLSYPLINPYYPISNERTVALSKNVALPKNVGINDWQGINSLANKNVVAIRGYDYDKILPVAMNYVEVNDHAQAWGMVAKGRADFYIDEVDAINHFKNTNSSTGIDFQLNTVLNEYTYLGFSQSKHGQHLADIYDARMEVLLKNNKISELYQRHGLPNPISDAQYAAYINLCKKKSTIENY